MAMDEGHGARRRARGTDFESHASEAAPAGAPVAHLRRRPGARGHRKRIYILGAVGAFLLLAGGLAVNELAQKLFDLRYRLQLLESRQESFGQREVAAAEREQALRGAAQLPVPATESPFRKGSWEKIGASTLVPGWPGDYAKTKALAVHADRLYVGLAHPGNGPPQIWSFDGTRWEKAGSAELVPGWSRHTYVSALASDGTRLYAGIDDTVWAFDARQGWQQIGGDARAGSWPRGMFNAYALAVHRGRLFAGMTGGAEAAVYAYGPGGWQKVGAWPDERYSGVYELWSHTDGFLYAGMIARPGPTAVFRYDGTRWEKIGGDGVNGSWTTAGFSHALSFASLDGRLVVSMNRHPMAVGNFSSIWVFDGRRWQPVGLGRIPPLWGHMYNYNAIAAYAGRLVIGAGGHPAGNVSVWEVEDGTRPVMVGGFGLKGSWSRNEESVLGMPRTGNNQYVYRFVVWRGDLVAGFGDDPGSAVVWRYRPAREPPSKEAPARH